MVVLDQEPMSLGLVLLGLSQTIDKLALEFAQVAAEFSATSEWDDDGYNTAADWIRFDCHMNSNMVWNALWVGEQGQRLEQSVQAMKRGEIGFAHLATMAKTANAVGKAFDESKLLPLAQKHSPGKFFHKCEHYRHSVDADAYTKKQEQMADQRSLRLSTAQDGCLLISGVLDPVSGAEVRGALEPLAKPSGAHDHRTRDQRMADALHEKVTGGQPAHLQVTAAIETLKGLVGAAGGEMEFSLPLAASTVQRIACDCAVTRVLLDQDSLTIDVGRATQKIPVALRKALLLRDRHCRWPGCERPALYCDGHHMTHWAHGGKTDLDNVILLCKRHHRMVHEGGWQVVKADGEIVSVAPTISFGFPRGPD